MEAVHSFLPVASQFQPDVVAISAGFDAHLYDPLLSLRVTAGSYYKIGQLLSDQFDRLFATLEGGYNSEVLSKCIYNFVAGINGEAMPFHEKDTTSVPRVREEYKSRLHSVIKNLKPYWKF